ncbi:tyrosine recombinase XerC [Falsihalocynthiibacter sp. BN13B15]|uniref:site-specific integrase n=1 Tax=Falsihalocynthiibacter sp. BN13B15 TaxID=3240871 RepID=UPI003510269D
MVKKTTKPHLHKITRKGREYWYFRRSGKYIRLPDDPDSREFDTAYWEIRSGKTSITKTTFDALVTSYYQTPRFKSLKPNTRTEYRRTLELIREKNGKRDFTKMRRRDVIAARDAYADTWRKANAMVEQLSILANHAIELEWIIANPASGVSKLKGGEYHPWPEDKLEAFERYCKRESLDTELLAFHLCTGTGQRIGDVVKMEWSHFDGEYMEVLQEKTNSRVWVFCPARLRAHLANAPRAGKHILAKNLTTPISKRHVQKLVLEVREAIGAKEFVIHGWRYNAARELADAGCSDSEIQAVTGHKTLTMVQKYRAQANQKKLSKTAQERRNRTNTKRESDN